MLRFALLFVGGAVGLVTLIGHGVHAQQTPAAPSAADLAVGKAQYVAHCAGCHGPTGDSGRASNLARPQLDQADTDAALRRIIRQGIPGTEMPGSFQLTDDEIVKVAAYVRTLGTVAPEIVRGDAARGLPVFKAQCLGCHYVNGEGGVMGPVLTGIGARRGAAWLRAKLLDPAATLADDFRLVELTTRTGQKASGIRINEDTTSIQIRDMSGRPRSFWKSNLTALARHADRSPMPSYKGRLTDAQLDDVVAYLASLKEGRKP